MTSRVPLVIAALLTLGTAAAPAGAQRWGGGYGDDRGYDRSYGYGQPYRGDAYRDPYRGGYDRPGYYRGYDERRYAPRRCSSGTTGTIIGALAGGLLGRAVDTRGDRALGTVLGAGAGALAGHAVEKGSNPGYCR